ncbi:MAG: ribonuclease BN (tRNA processing enzyme) [Candidatus Krumholzibacteriia bacterium]|jgi:ribonuclease BN (tRNA processing enzyme)
MIRFRILGAGGAIPTPTHTFAAYWVTVDQTSILMDPGPGALVRLVQSGDAPGGVDEIERVLFTHLHPDHCGDLVALLFALHSPLTASRQPLRLYGPVGLSAYLDKLRQVYGRWLEPKQRELIVTEWAEPESLALPDGGKITLFAVDHPQDRFSADGCLGYKFIDAAGHTVVFSGDTGPCAGLSEAAIGADLLVVECSAPAGLGIRGHMDSHDVGRLCAASQPSSVVLTHQYPAAAAADLCAEIAPYFKGPVAQAQDGHLVHIPSTRGENSV